MAKAKKIKPRDYGHRWRVTLLKATLAKYLGHVEAVDEATAIEKAAKEFRVPDNVLDQITVMVDDREVVSSKQPANRAGCHLRRMRCSRADGALLSGVSRPGSDRSPSERESSNPDPFQHTDHERYTRHCD